MTQEPEFLSARMALSFYDNAPALSIAPIIPVTAKGLCKLVVINSYVKGKARVVNVNDHTHVAGRNGRGKTTLLRLIPLFYGEQPSKMVKPSGEVLRPIREYMFDALSSYLVFEYLNHSGVKLAIMYYGSGDSPTYTLCDGPYESNLFTENGEFIESRILNGRLKARGRNPTPAMGVMEYQSIIQGRNDRQKHDLRNHIRRFSLAEKGSLAGVEKIASAMFFKDITFQALKRMAYSVVSDDTEHKITTSLTEKGLKTFFANFRAHQDVMKHSMAFIEGTTLHIQIGQAQRQKRACAVKANLLSRYKAEEALSIQEQISSIEQRLRDERDNHSRQVVAINTRIGDLQAVIKRNKALITAIEQEESMYAANRMDDARTLVSAIPSLEAEKMELEGILRGLKEKSSNITAKYERELAQLFESHTIKNNGIREELAGFARKRDTDIEQIEALQAAECEAEFEAQRAQNQELDGQLAAAQEKVVMAKVSKAEIRISEEYAVKLMALEEQREHLREEESGLRDDLNRKKDEKNGLQGQYQRKDEELNSAYRVLEEKRDELSHLLRLESPDPGSLLYFLRENRLSWFDNIGKVIREDLLIKPGLSPEMAEDGGGSLYGIDIDLSKVDSGLAAREEALAEQIRAIRGAIGQDELRVSDLEPELKSLKKQLEAAGKEISTLESQLEKKRQNIGETLELIKITKRAADEDMRIRRETADLQIREAERAERDIAAHNQGKRKEFEERNRTIVAKFAARKKHARDAYLAEEARINAALVAADQDYRRTCAAIQKNRDEELKTGGVNPEAIRDIEIQVEEKGENLEKARAMREAVEAYQRWREKRLPERDEAREILVDTEAKLDQENSAKERLVRSFNEVCMDYEDRLAAQKAKLLANQEYQRNLNAFRANHGTEHYGFALGEQVEPAGLSFERIAADFAAASHAISDSRIKRDRLLQPIHNLFQRAPEGTFIADFSVGMPDAYVDTGDNSTVEQIIAHLRNWYNEGHSQSRDAINGQCQAACGMFSTYLDSLLDFQSKMQTLSRQLQNSLKSEMAFDAIRDVSIRLSGRVERVPYWADLNGVAEEFKRWGRDGYVGVPPTALINNLTALTSHMATGRLEEVPEDLIDMEILVDDGTVKRVSNEAELKNVSSNGLSSLVMCMIFVAFVNRVRKDEDIWLTWALDEIGAIDSGNSKGLLQMLEHHRIRLVSASPKSDESVLSLFRNHYEVLPNFEIQHCEPAKRRNTYVR